MGNQVDLTLRVGSELSGLYKAKSELNDFFTRFKGQVANGLGFGAGFGLAGMGIQIVTGIAREFGELQKSIGLTVENIERNRAAIGLSATAYQVFSNTLTAANQDANTLTPSLSNLSRVIGEAAIGSTTAAAKLAAIGVTSEQLRGLAPERQFELIARRLANLSDANVRDAAAADLLGRSYSSLKPLIEALARDGFDGLARKVEATTGIIKDEYSQAIDDAKQRSENAGKRIENSLAGPISKWTLLVANAKAYAKTVAADIISGGGPNVPLTRAQVLANLEAEKVRNESRGKSIAQLEELISKELESFKYINDYSSQSNSLTGMSADDYLGVITARIKAFEEARDAAQADLQAADARNNPLSPDAYAEGARNTRSNFLKNEQAFDERMKQLTAQARAESERRDNQARSLEFTKAQSDYARQLAAIESTISRIEANRFLTTEQKSTAIQPILREENKLIADRIALLQAELDTNYLLTQAEKQQLQDRIDALNKDRASNQGKQTSGTTLGFGSQLSADLVKLRDQFGTTSQQISGFITNSIGTAIDGVSDGIYGLITKTKTWGQVGLQVGASILQSLIKTGVQIGVNSVLGLAAQNTQKAAAATTGPAIAASYAPASAAVNTATYGSSAVVGAAAAAVAIGLIIGLLAKNSFSDGGRLQGSGTSTSDSILMRGSTDEFMVRAAAARAIGYDRLNYMNSTGRVPGFANGGPIFPSSSLQSSVSSSASPSSAQPTYIVFSESELRRRMMGNGDFDANVLRVMERNQWRS